MSKKQAKNSKKKLTPKNDKIESTDNFKFNLKCNESATSQKESRNHIKFLNNELTKIEKSYLERVKFDFYLRLASHGFQKANEIPELLNLLIENPDLIDNFGEELHKKSIDNKISLSFYKVNTKNPTNLTNEIRNISYIFFQNSPE